MEYVGSWETYRVPVLERLHDLCMADKPPVLSKARVNCIADLRGEGRFRGGFRDGAEEGAVEGKACEGRSVKF